MNEQEQLTRILTLVELTNSRLDQLGRDIKEANKRIEDEVEQRDERFFQLVKKPGQTDRAIIIATASFVILSPVLGAVVDLVSQFWSP